MIVRKLFGLGLVGALSSYIKSHRHPPIAILCDIKTGLNESYQLEVEVQNIDDRFTHLLEKNYRTFFLLINDLTEQVAEAQKAFPDFPYLRTLRFPSKEHKRKYILRDACADEQWLEKTVNAVLFRSKLYNRYEIHEQYRNGTWIPFCQTALDSVNEETAVRITEGAFQPYKCTADVIPASQGFIVNYTLCTDSGKVEHEGVVFAYNFDTDDQFMQALEGEKDDLEDRGFTFEDIDLYWLR